MKVAGHVARDVQYPTSSGTFNKEPDYILNLQNDLDRLIQDEFLERSHTPSYVARMGQEVGPTRECFLFTKKLVAPSKVEQHLEKSSTARPTTAPPPSARPRFVKTNDRHQYLSATETGDESRHGRPTRTSILRARHRINSAPPASPHDDFRVQRGAQSDRPPSSVYKVSKRPTSAASVASTVDSVQNEIMRRRGGLEGETVHQFLIGARYNTAHYVDRKAIERYGVYMPRSSPGQFFTRSETTGRVTTPSSRPGSPIEAWNTSTRPTSASSTTFGPPSTARPPTPAAESDSVVTTGPEHVHESVPLPTDSNEPLSVRGSRLSTSRPPQSPAGPQQSSGLDRGVSPRSTRSARTPSPLPHVVGLSLGAAGRGRAISAMRSRRVIVSARFGGSTVGNAAAAAQRRAGGVAGSDITRAFSVRPWRDARALRQAIVERVERGVTAPAEKPVEVPVLPLQEEEPAADASVHLQDLETPNV